MVDSTIIALGTLVFALFVWFRRSKGGPLPPGPKPMPFLGNIKDLTTKELWLPAREWAKQYGDVVHLHVGPISLIFLNSPEACFDLLDKRGSIYSDKPQLTMSGELCGCKHMIAFTGYGEESRQQRKLMNKAFGLPAIPEYHPLLSSSTNAFLQGIILSPNEYLKHIRRYAGGLTLSVVYGYEAKSINDPFLSLAEESVNILANEIASGGGVWLVDIFPFLKHLPTWFPGAGFKRKAISWKAKMEEFTEKPFGFVKDSMNSGMFKPSFCSTLLEDEDAKASDPDFEFNLKWTANSMYSASADNTITTISHFLLAMMKHPEFLRRAQEEIDTVVGTDRLPTFNDRPALPYVDAIMEETWRWGVPLPLSLPHRLMEDDIYRGMYIPKGSLIFGNIWAICQDESIYPNPDIFNPERFLEPADEETKRKRNPRRYVFGFGRRLCPGINLVESSIWLLLVRVIATLDISKPKHPVTGETIEPDVTFENPIFRTPSSFKCDIKPRSEQALRLIGESKLA
ncbi:hypothetical protein M422DRAFT_32381 [Sphaerobolus stellatus SS14]|uniref:Cytochrome P450 n=1 Tax=Sphaerobolus stellatus (strain SS14) TaxID=990650 RepID=A0A0C9UZ03_SPHS4|nr:hypothetical protein M422DRAFT_32381 [Sphaerobolus stellatus SS14]